MYLACTDAADYLLHAAYSPVKSHYSICHAHHRPWVINSQHWPFMSATGLSRSRHNRETCLRDPGKASSSAFDKALDLSGVFPLDKWPTVQLSKDGWKRGRHKGAGNVYLSNLCLGKRYPRLNISRWSKGLTGNVKMQCSLTFMFVQG